MEYQEELEVAEEINYPEVTRYLRELLPEHSGILREIETAVKGDDYFPIVKPETAAFLETLCRALRPASILEVGTAVGYSAILMARAAGENTQVTTIERYGHAAALARENFKKAGLSSRITLLFSDADEVLPCLKGRYDLIFLDAAKGQYPKWLPMLYELLNDGGVLVCDNVLYKGMTDDPEKLEYRKRTLVKRLRQFLHQIVHFEGLTTSVLPLGDGVTISVKGRKDA